MMWRDMEGSDDWKGLKQCQACCLALGEYFLKKKYSLFYSYVVSYLKTFMLN